LILGDPLFKHENHDLPPFFVSNRTGYENLIFKNENLSEAVSKKKPREFIPRGFKKINPGRTGSGPSGAS